jgi:NAD+ kinase
MQLRPLLTLHDLSPNVAPNDSAMPNKFKTVAIIGKPDGVQMVAPLNTLYRLLKSRGIHVRTDARTGATLQAEADEIFALPDLIAGADLAIAVGGDGTLLGVARIAAAHHVPLLGINLGTLGFLTDVPKDDMELLVPAVLDGRYTEEQRLMLDAAVLRGRETIFEAVALNDVVVSRGAMGTMIEFAVIVDGEFIYSLRADGLIISTPTGSTAYALSSGGPILHPSLPAISLVPISPHTLSNRPIAIGSGSEVQVKIIRGTNARVNFDVQSFFDPASDDVVLVKADPNPLRLLHPDGYSYFGMLRTKLHWNERTS